MYSQTALKLYALRKEGTIKSNAHFWREFNNREIVAGVFVDTGKYVEELRNGDISLTCCFDGDFPDVPKGIKYSEVPFLFAYRGDIGLLKNISRNVAVVGVLTPTDNILEREKNIIERLLQKDICIVSGLANGCDTAAHTECLIHNGKTVAFLPSTLENIFPKQNTALAEKIVQGGGLVITEYVTEPNSRYESIKRFIERDRLQAMFAKRIILIASYLQGQGDSGSRHAMAKAKEYGRERFVMYDENFDKDKPIFGLNKSLIDGGATVLTTKILNTF